MAVLLVGVRSNLRDEKLMTIKFFSLLDELDIAIGNSQELSFLF